MAASLRTLLPRASTSTAVHKVRSLFSGPFKLETWLNSLGVQSVRSVHAVANATELVKKEGDTVHLKLNENYFHTYRCDAPELDITFTKDQVRRLCSLPWSRLPIRSCSSSTDA